MTADQTTRIANDYRIKRNELEISTNAALIRYVLDAYNIDIHTLGSNPLGQQIIVKNFDDIKRYLNYL